ncbi:unnamed protein product [Caenorhabditis angaria]|uniref:Uncharacterized protein n=1 Tax=Caenorhabditis angaria TaxID=860376 RepID=A0A9P1IW74_9PELO|nr:unnamed protein product [Caenorhabditis angaria]
MFFQTTVPCPTIEYFQHPIFVLSLDNTLNSIGIGIIIIAALSQSLFFSIHSIHHLKNISNFISKNTQKLQKSVFTAISLQVLTTTAVAIIPASYFVVSIQADYYNQAINNFCIILFSIHGFLATISMLIFHKYYRTFILSCFYNKKNDVPNPSFTIVLRHSQVSCK